MNNLTLNETRENLNYSDTIVLTSTLYNDSPEGVARSQAAREFLENSTLTGIRIVMCDGGSGKDFLNFVKKLPNVTLLEYHNNPELQKSHAPRRKDGMGYILKHFSESKFILWTEPEKAEMLLPVNLSRVITPLRGGKVEQTIPTPKPHDNRPEYMRAIEMRAMRRAMDIVNHGEFRPKSETYGVNIRGSHEEASVEDLSKIYGEQSIDSHKIVDHWFGPRAFTRTIAENYFMKSDRKIWDWIILPSAQAQYEKNTTLGVSVDFQYSPPQLANENDPAQRPAFTQKRIQQYRTLITGFMQEFSKKD